MMEEKEINIKYNVYKSVDELNAQYRNLVDKARDAAKNAYAPYSQFNVGAAVLLENGTVIQGNNQENVASPTTSCAERTAIFYTGANYPNEIIAAIAIAARSKKMTLDDSLSPCGNCRQTLFEYEKKQHSPIRVLLYQPDGKVWQFESVSALLPFSFWVDLA